MRHILRMGKSNLQFIYRHNDAGKTYYVMTAQNSFDAWVNAFIGGNPQAAAHELFKGGNAIAGTSLNPPDTMAQFEQIHKAEIEQFESAVASIPGGAYLVAGYKIYSYGKSLFVSVPQNLKIVDRDKIIFMVMSDAGISTTSSSSNIISAALEADKFVQDYNYVFQKILGDQSQYDLGKAFSKGGQASQKAYDLLYWQYRYTIHDQLLSQVIGGTPEFYANYRWRNGRDFPAQFVYDITWADIGQPNHDPRFPVSTYDVAHYLATIIAKQTQNALKNNYDAIIKYFQQIFCEG